MIQQQQQYCSDNDELENMIVLGNAHLNGKSFQMALDCFKKSLELYTDHVQSRQFPPTTSSSFVATTLLSVIYYKIGLGHFYLEQHEQAIPFFEKALENDPNGYANACTMLFNSLWKLNSCVYAIMVVHDFLNNHPSKKKALEPILNNLKESKFWYLDPRLRIVKLSQDNYCVQAIEDIPVEEVIRIYDESGEREEYKGVTIVKDSLLCHDQFITGACLSSDESIVTVGITLKHLIQNLLRFQNVLRGLHPRKINEAPEQFSKEWRQFFFEHLQLVKQNIGVKEEFEGMSLEEIEHLENDKERLEEVIRLTMVIKLNGFIGGVYGLACLFNHSCEENCEKIDEKIVTTRNIKKGEFVCLNYMGFDDTLGNRRKYLMEHFAFECECSRCQREIMAGMSLDADEEEQEDLMEEQEVTVTDTDLEQ